MSRNIEVKCKNCRATFNVPAESLGVHESGSEYRKMGLEVFYQGRTVSNCPECEVEFEIDYEASQYPEGMENYSEFNTTGVVVQSAPQMLDFTRRPRYLDFYRDADYGDEGYTYEYENEAFEAPPLSSLILPERGIINARFNEGVAELLYEIQKNNELIFEIDPRKFEELIAHVFRNHGFVVDLTKQSRDGGYDMIAMRNDLGIPSKYIIESKRYAPQNKVGVELVRSLAGVRDSIGANKAVLATTSTFTETARKFATAKHTTELFLDLKDYDDVMAWIKAQGRD